MNVAATIEGPTQVKLTVDDFGVLKRTDAFTGFSKVELLDGELSGVPLQDEDEPESDASVPIKLRVSDYLRLDEVGSLAEHGKTELINGIIYQMSPQHRPHWFLKNELTYRLRRTLEALGSGLYAGSEGSVLLSEHDLPEPDVIVTDSPTGPGPVPVKSVRLLVEVAHKSRSLDFGTKAERYALCGVPEYWVVDVNRRVIHQMWSPGPEGYVERDKVTFGKRIAAVTIAGLAVETDDLN